VKKLERAVAWWVAVSALVAGAAMAAGSGAQEALAAAERAFARTSAEQGVKPAFLAYLGDDAVIFRPRAVPGRKWMQDRPAPAIRLAWSPSFVQVSQAGDLGYTTGPYELRSADPKDTDVAYGRFVTVWRRQPDGNWRVALDIGVPTPKPKDPAAGVGGATEYGRLLAAVPAAAASDAAKERSALLTADRVFAATVAGEGAPATYAAHLGEGARLLRADTSPAVGAEAIRTALVANPFNVTWQPLEGGVSRSGDLGYTYGTASFSHQVGSPAHDAAYLRLWERAPGGDWKIVLDLLNPVPPPPPEVPPG
jgi:ketosteroid isomerase-like protein